MFPIPTWNAYGRDPGLKTMNFCKISNVRGEEKAKYFGPDTPQKSTTSPAQKVNKIELSN